MLRSGLALVPEHRRIFADFTVAENLRIGGVTLPAAERAARLDEVVGAIPVPAGDKWDTLAGFLSGRRSPAAGHSPGSDVPKPRLLMMDEPSLGLAPVLVNAVFDLICTSSATSGRTLLVVEQNAARMLEVADRVYVLRSGSVVAHGSGAEVLAQTDLFDTFVRGSAQ